MHPDDRYGVAEGLSARRRRLFVCACASLSWGLLGHWRGVGEEQMMLEVIDSLEAIHEEECLSVPQVYFEVLAVWADELEEAGDSRAAGLRVCVEERYWPYQFVDNKFYWFNDNGSPYKRYCNDIGTLVQRILGEGRTLLSHGYPSCSAALLALAPLIMEEL